MGDWEDALDIKLVLIGSTGVGKTSLVQRLVTGEAGEQIVRPTVGADFRIKRIIWKGEPINLHIWDLSGQDYCPSMGRAYYRNAEGCFLVTDSTNPKSIEVARSWKEDLDSKATLSVETVLLSNKADLPPLSGLTNDLEQLCKDTKIEKYFNTSVVAETNEEIYSALEYLVERILINRIDMADWVILDVQPTIRITTGKKKIRKNACSC